MLVKESHVDLQTSSGPMRVFIYQPNVPDYPDAKFPGVAVFTGNTLAPFMFFFCLDMEWFNDRNELCVLIEASFFILCGSRDLPGDGTLGPLLQVRLELA